MPAVFAAASALLVTLGDSPTLALTIPSKLQAYLAAGRPVIASLDGEGARVVREAAAGFTCPAGDAEALTAAVLRLHGLAPEERSRLGENGRRYFSAHFEPTRRVRELIEHFQDMARQGRENNR
jgi:glycosyltransferase involved in cell wall biosynthesis